MIGVLWGIFFNLAVTLFVINGAIWLRSKRRRVRPDAGREMFGAVASSFGGADFWSAALVVLINLSGAQAASAFTGATYEEAGQPMTPVHAGIAWLIQIAVMVLNWFVIHWRNQKFLDWRWSGIAALMIFAVSLAAGVVVMLIATA